MPLHPLDRCRLDARCSRDRCRERNGPRCLCEFETLLQFVKSAPSLVPPGLSDNECCILIASVGISRFLRLQNSPEELQVLVENIGVLTRRAANTVKENQICLFSLA